MRLRLLSSHFFRHSRFTLANRITSLLPTTHPESCPSISRTTFADLEDEVTRLRATS
jgi:hypothetical protein